MTKLPKLTVDIFNRPECPPWAKWAAVDKSGECYVYSDKPSRNRLTWMWSLIGSCKYIDDYDSSDWQNSLIERPVNPDNKESDTEVKQLPKLTVDVFNRPYYPEWIKYNFAAVDKDGEGYVYSCIPVMEDGSWKLKFGECCYVGDYDPYDWQNSLIQRPISSPDINDVQSESDSDMYHEALEKDTSITENNEDVPPEFKRLFSNKRKPTSSVYVGSEIKKDADDVKHPNHYTDTPFGLEVIEITKHYDFCTGNALKYIFRHGKKVYDGLTVKDSAIKDLRKAIQNLEFKIKFIEEEWDDKGTCKSSKEVICPECGRATASIWSKDGELNGMVTCLSCGYTFDPIFERYQNTDNTIL